MARIVRFAIAAIACVALFAPAARAVGAPRHNSTPAAALGTASDRMAGVGQRMRVADDDWEEVPSTGSGAAGSREAAPGAAARGSSDADSGGHPERGPDGAPVTIVEFGDFQCPYCRRVEGTLREVRQHYGDKVRLVFEDFPLSFHHNAMNAALAARCAGEQDKFWQYHDALFSNQAALSPPDLKALADNLGLNISQFDACFDGRKYESEINADQAEARRAGADGTPYFLINDKPLSGAAPFSTFQSMINNALAQSGGGAR